MPWNPEQYLMVSFISFLRLLFLLVVLRLSPFISYSFLKTSASHYALIRSRSIMRFSALDKLGFFGVNYEGFITKPLEVD